MIELCKKCKFNLNDKCNRLVSSIGFGCSDRVGSDYAKDNCCDYYEQGQPKCIGETTNLCWYNS